MVTWLPRESATTPSLRSSRARFCPYWPNSVEARRLSSKVSTVWVVAVSSGTEGASVPLSVVRLRNELGSGGDEILRGGEFCIDSGAVGERSEQAVGSGIRNCYRNHLADQVFRRHHLDRLEIWRAAGELARE